MIGGHFYTSGRTATRELDKGTECPCSPLRDSRYVYGHERENLLHRIFRCGVSACFPVFQDVEITARANPRFSNEYGYIVIFQEMGTNWGRRSAPGKDVVSFPLRQNGSVKPPTLSAPPTHQR
jgi:hypothetical protein